MEDLSESELEFLQSGGALWCMRELNGSRWEIYKILKSGEDIFDVFPESKKRAQAWLFILAELSNSCAAVNVHHSVPRSTPADLKAYPLLI